MVTKICSPLAPNFRPNTLLYMITSRRIFGKKKTASSYLVVFLIFLTLGILIIFLSLNFRIIKERKRITEEFDSLKAEIQKLESKRSDLLSKISETENDDYLEKVGREDLNLQKEGEKVVAYPIIEKKEEEKKENEVEKGNFWQEILKKFGIR